MFIEEDGILSEQILKKNYNVRMLGFVVRSRNEQLHIGFALQSIFDSFGNETQVVVVDNDSTDDTLKVIQMFPKKFFNIEVVNVKDGDYTPGKSLNIGIENLRNKACSIAGILSSHCEITKIDKLKINEYFKNDTCFALMGKQIPIKQGKRINPRYIWANFNQSEPILNPKEQTLLDEERFFFHNAFSFIKIQHWENLKFDETLAGKEDRYWAKDQISLGRYFILDPNLQCRHFWTERGATWRD